MADFSPKPFQLHSDDEKGKEAPAIMTHTPLSSQHHHVCSWWVAYTFDNPVRKLIHTPRKILDDYIKEGMTVMDVGCGMGYFSIGMAKLVGADGKVIIAVQPVCPPARSG